VPAFQALLIAGATGLEPATSGVTGRIRASSSRIYWQKIVQKPL
jgi:hypothetical protein